MNPLARTRSAEEEERSLMNVAPGATFEAVIDWGATGATLGTRIVMHDPKV